MTKEEKRRLQELYAQDLLNQRIVLDSTQILDPSAPFLYIPPPVEEIIIIDEENVPEWAQTIAGEELSDDTDDEDDLVSEEEAEEDLEEYILNEDLDMLAKNMKPEDIIAGYENGEVILQKRKRPSDFSENIQPIKRTPSPMESVPSISVVTWNIEKIGKNTHGIVAERKSRALASILDELQPMIMVMQEVSDAPFFLDGDGQLKGERNMDVFDMYKNNIHFGQEYHTGIQKLKGQLQYDNIKKILETPVRNTEDKDIEKISDQFIKKISEIWNNISTHSVYAISDISFLLMKWLKKKKKWINNKKAYWKNPKKVIGEEITKKKVELAKINKKLTDKKKLLQSIRPTAKKKLEKTNEVIAALEEKIKILGEKIKILEEELSIPDLKEKAAAMLINEMKIFGEEANEILQFLNTEIEVLTGIDITESVLGSEKIANKIASMLAVYATRFSTFPDEVDKNELSEIYQSYKNPVYLLSKEYKMLEGPQFIADVDLSMMSDYYPVFYNTANIPDDPDLYTYDLKTNTLLPLNYKEKHYTFRYGTVTNDQLKKALQKKKQRLNELNQQVEKSEEEQKEILMLTELIEHLEKNELPMQIITNRKTGEVETLYADKENGVFKENRRLVLWKFRIPVHRYNFRVPNLRNDLFAYSSKLGRLQTYAEYTELFIGVVHTSPSLDIKKEITAILEGAKQLSQKEGIPVLLGGDWYMQKKMPDEFKKLQEGTFADWTLIAPSNSTNLPGIGHEGQIADHFLGQKGKFTSVSTRSLPPLAYTEGMDGTETANAWMKGYEKKRLDAWNNMVVDHTPVHSIVNIHLDTNLKKTAIDMLKTPVNGSYTPKATFNTYETLQGYITTGLCISYIKDGTPQNSYTGNGTSIENLNKINELITVSNTYSPLKLNTGQLNDGQLLTNIPDMVWSYAKAILGTDGSILPSVGRWVNGHSSTLTEQRSCIFTTGITQGFGLIVSSNTNEQWYTSVANCKGPTPSFQQLSELITWENGPEARTFSALIVINRARISQENEASQLVAGLIDLLITTGILSDNISVYQSYSTGQSPNLSIGIDSNGTWGEVLDEDQDPVL